MSERQILRLIIFGSFSETRGSGGFLFDSFSDFSNSLVPRPNFIRPLGGYLTIKDKIVVKIANIDSDDYILHDLRTELIKIFSEAVNLDIGSVSLPPSDIGAVYPKTLERQPEGYYVFCDHDSIELNAKTRQGLFYAVQTLIQILNSAFNASSDEKQSLVPRMTIIDFPCLELRGIADDITRGQVPTVDSVNKYIRTISHFKMNAYAIGYEQDFYDFESFPIDFDYKACLTKEEIKKIQDYAEKRFVDLFPIYTSFGHQDNLLQKTEYRDLGEFPGSQCYNIADNRIYDMLDAHYRELADVFDSKSFHMGCDESFDLGMYRSKKYLEDIGVGRALLKHYKRMFSKAKELGKEDIYIYHDIVTNYEDELKDAPKDLRIMYWEYSPKRKYRKVGKLVELGFPIVVSPSHLNWCRHFPDFINAAENTINLIETAKQVNRCKSEDVPGVLGQLNSIWGDFTNHNLRENNIYGSVLSGACSWTESPTEARNFLDAFIFQYYRIRKEGPLETLSRIVWDTADLIRFYSSLGVMLPQPFYMHLYRHPFHTPKPKPYIKKYRDLIRESSSLLVDLDAAMPHINLNRETVQYLKYGIKIARYMGLKDKFIKNSSNQLKEMQKARSNNDESEDVLKESLLSEIRNFKQVTRKIAEDYENLWIACAKRPVLDFTLGRFNNLIKYCDDKESSIANRVYYANPFLPSEWIEGPKSVKPPVAVLFRRKFEIEDVDTNIAAKALVMAGDHAKLYINGNRIGDIHSRMSLSFVPIKERIQVFDVVGNLRQGTNVIVIESYNYISGRNTANLLLRLKFKDVSDDQFTVRDIITNGNWEYTLGYDAENPDVQNISPPVGMDALDIGSLSIPNNKHELKQTWDVVKSLGRPPALNGHVYDADILSGDIPYTEEYFGFESYTYGVFYNMIHPLVAKIAKPLFGLIKKILKIR